MRKEIKYYGIHACLSLTETRMDDVIKIYIHSSNLKSFSKALKRCADAKKAYHIVSNEELDKISASVHHEGICVLAKEKLPLNDKTFLKELSHIKGNVCILYFDGVQNPHNIGSILRSCAHFSVPFILGEKGKLPALTPSACRIAKGGAEIVHAVEVDNPSTFLPKLIQAGFMLVSTSSHAKASLYDTALPAKMVLVLGAESTGVGKAVSRHCSLHLKIPGSEAVESLNVSVATGLCLGEFYRQHMRGSAC